MGTTEPISKRRINKPRESGITMLLGTVSMLFIVPMVGLAVDVGFLYAVKSKMQAAVDGAALAAARALSIGQSLASQTTSAQNNAVTWFNANFPSNYFGTQNTVMGTSNVQVFPDPNNPQLRNVTVTATSQVNTFFMKWLGFGNTPVGATGNASRRTVVAMVVLDRSGSMCNGGSAPCNTASATPCGTMAQAAKLFTGQFAENSDYIGLVSFAQNAYVHSQPVQTFQTVLGYQNSSGSGNGAIDQIICNSWTGTANALSVAYQLIEQANLPGALNIILLETDGLPNTLTLNFWDSTNNVVGLQGGNCKDAAGKTIAAGGFKTLASMPNWTPGLNLKAAPFYTSGGPFTNIPAGAVGAVAVDDPGGTGFYTMYNYWTKFAQTQSRANNYNTADTVQSNGTNSGCNFSTAGQNNPSDFAWFPKTDVYGNALNPAYGYLAVTTDGQGHITQSGSNPTNYNNLHAAVKNATADAAYKARTDPNIPVTVFAIGLGGNGAPLDPVLLQRIANDPNGDNFNTGGPFNGGFYQPCALEVNCLTWGTQPQGTYVYSPSASNLGQAFLRISSQVLRLSK
jgi:Flp pilus assembly protein TadG